MKANWINRIENVVIVVLCLIAVKLIMIKPLEDQLERQNATIEHLAQIEKYSYQILNQFEDRIKAKDGQIIIDLNSEQFVIPEDPDTIKQEPEKKGFFKRLFNLK